MPEDNKGVFVVLAGREKEDFSFWRGNLAQGVRGIIDPFDPLNPYGPRTGGNPNDASRVDGKFLDPKMISAVTAVTGTTAATMNLSKVSAISLEDSDAEFDQTIDDINPYYQRGSVQPFGSILMSAEHQEEFFEVPPNWRKLLYDDAVDELTEFTKGVDLATTTILKSHINSWGISSNNYFADNILGPKMPNLQVIDFSDTIHY